MKIGVFLNDYNHILPFYSSGIVEIYSDAHSDWQCINQIPFDLTEQRDLADVQLKVNMLTSEFDDCKLLITDAIKPLAMALLQEKGIGVWKSRGHFVTTLLDHIKAELNKVLEDREHKKNMGPTLIGPENEAKYEINLIPLLSQDRSLNSMDILIPFLKTTNFKELRITCSHLPKWFNGAIESLKLEASVAEPEPNLMVATVKPVVWTDDIRYRKRVIIPGMRGCTSGGC